jgi:hypothetical protein
MRSEIAGRQLVNLTRHLRLFPYGTPGKRGYLPVLLPETKQLVLPHCATKDQPCRKVVQECGLISQASPYQLGLDQNLAR